jgi:hypothetical protein
MSFLTKAELKTVADEAIIDIITGVDDTIADQIIAESIDVMSSYLSNYYNAAAIFAASGSGRSLMVLKHLKDIVIYEIYIRHTRDMNEVAKARYDEAMNWLEKMNTGEFKDSRLPEVPGAIDSANDQAGMEMRFSSKTKYESSF